MSSRQSIISPGTHPQTCDTGFLVPLFFCCCWENSQKSWIVIANIHKYHQAQISGVKTWYLRPPPECASSCHPTMQATLYPGWWYLLICIFLFVFLICICILYLYLLPLAPPPCKPQSIQVGASGWDTMAVYNGDGNGANVMMTKMYSSCSYFPRRSHHRQHQALVSWN